MSDAPREGGPPRVIWPVFQAPEPFRAPAPPTPPPPRPPERIAARPSGGIPRGVLIAVGLFVLINAILLGLYVWSQGGQHVHVRMVARGDQFVGYLDGRRQVDATYPTAPQTGGIVITLEDTERLPSLPTPRGIDRVRVTDLTTGQLLFEDDFSHGASSLWQSVSTTMKEESGVLRSDGVGTLILAAQNWRDYAVDVDVENATGVAVAVRVVERGTGVEFGARHVRHYDSSISLLEGGQSAAGELGLPVEVSRVETVKGLVSMILRPYPLMFLLLAAAFVLVLAIQWLASFIRPIDLPPVPRDIPWLAAAWLVAAAFGVTLYLNYSYGSHVPHVPDEVAYLYQAKIFASGRLAAPAPPVEQVFDYFYPPFIIVSDGKWSSVYTFGHPAVLAIGTLFGVVWAMPSLLGAGTVALTFAIGRKLYATRVGLLAAAMLASSPFFLMSSSNFMSHNTVAFFLLASMFLVIVADRRPLVCGALGGLCFGFLFNTRPLEATAVMPAFGLLLLSRLLPREGRSVSAKQIGAFLAGGLVMFGAYLLYNLGTTSDAFSSALQQGNEESKILGFGGEHSVSLGIQNEHIQMVFLVLVLHGWPVFIGLGFVLLPVILASRSPWDWFLLLCALSIMTAYLFFRGHGIMHGPRYWYPAAPLLMLLAARGADRAAGLLSDGATYVRQRLPGDGRPQRWAGVLVVYPFVVGLIFVSVNGWLMGREQWWADEFVPARAEELKGFNGANDGLLKLIDDSDLSHALVLIDECNGWQCYGGVFWTNAPTLDGNVVIARNIPEHLAELFDAYPDRQVFVASSVGPTIQPYGEAGIPGVPLSQRDKENAPAARDVARPTVVPTPTPNVADIAARDEQRRTDLVAVAGALETYHERHGFYPGSNGVQSLCRYRDLDGGCALVEVLDPLPHDPQNDGDYWYNSDGTAYVLYALMETPQGEGACGDNPPFAPDQVVRLFCLRGPAPPNS